MRADCADRKEFQVMTKLVTHMLAKHVTTKEMIFLLERGGREVRSWVNECNELVAVWRGKTGVVYSVGVDVQGRTIVYRCSRQEWMPR